MAGGFDEALASEWELALVSVWESGLAQFPNRSHSYLVGAEEWAGLIDRQLKIRKPRWVEDASA